MDWYCAIWNSDKVNNEMGAQFLYEKLCEGDTSLVGDIDIIDNLYNELMLKKLNIQVNKGSGFIIIGCLLEDAEYINNLLLELSKKHGLSFYEPQNMTYSF